MLYTGMTRGKPGNGFWVASVLFLFFGWAFFSGLKFFFKRHREIVVSDEGVAALAFGHTWTLIRWTDMVRIERIRCPMVTIWNAWRNGFEFVVVGPRDEQIHFVDEISNVADLLRLLNDYVERYHVPLVALDRGSDTRATIRATTRVGTERRRLLRQGYQTSLSTLSMS